MPRMDARTRITVNSTEPPAASGGAQPAAASAAAGGELVDPFGRAVTYLRISVTDRCDFRCSYCMGDNPVFLPRKDILSLEEIDAIATAFVRLGVRKIRLTGGEPLVRRNIMWLVRRLARHLHSGALNELTLTTNGSQLARFAHDLAAAGVRRINVSLDTLDERRFRALTRHGDLSRVLQGLQAARAAGLKVKVNTVALKDINDAEIPQLVEWAHGQGFDITLIETMPMGDPGHDRAAHYLPLSRVRSMLEQRYTLEPDDFSSGGPSRYVRVRETGGRLGFITPLSAHFCDACNRVRLTAAGRLFLCLGQNDHADLRAVLRASGGEQALQRAIRAAIARKPRGHDFAITERETRGKMPRTMNVTGG